MNKLRVVGAVYNYFQQGTMTDRNKIIRGLDDIKNQLLNGTFPH